MKKENRIKEAVEMIGGPNVAASVCGVGVRSIYKWMATGRLPRSAFSGEKPYAEMLEKHPQARFTADWLLDRTKQIAA